jgi:DNA polymerase-1
MLNLSDIKIITLDTETDTVSNKPNPWTDKLIMLQYRYNEQGEVKFVEFDKGGWPDELLLSVLKSTVIIKRGQNVKFDALTLHNAGISIVGPFDDSRILAYLDNPFESIGLKDLVKNKLHKEVKTYDEITHILVPSKSKAKKDTGKMVTKRIKTSEVERNLLKEYGADDIYNCDKLRSLYFDSSWYKKVEQPLVDVLFRIEKNGMGLDRPYLEQLNKDYEKEIEQIRSTFGEQLNPNSPKQLLPVLQSINSQFGYGVGVYDTEKLTKKRLAWKGSELASRLLRYSELNKLNSTYIKPLLARMDGASRIHGSFNQAGSSESEGGTKTGRLSSEGPNLQNIPSRTNDGKKVRRAFIAGPGRHMFVSDKSQIEPRFLAHFSQSKKLIKAYQNKEDTHSLFASDIFGKTISNISKLERFIGKTVWLATVYGCWPKKVQEICEKNSDDPLPYTLADYEAIQKAFIDANKEIWNWRNEHIQITRRLGYIETFGGRRIHIPNLYSKNQYEREAAERCSISYFIQGSAADDIKLSMIEADKALTPSGSFLTAQIHDELVGELTDKELIKDIHRIMVSTSKLNNVPLEAETKLVGSWADKG